MWKTVGMRIRALSLWVEVDSRWHHDSPLDDERRAAGLGLPRLGYERPAIVRSDFISRLLRDPERMAVERSA